MNWWRGLLRLWAVLSVLWVLMVAGVAGFSAYDASWQHEAILAARAEDARMNAELERVLGPSPAPRGIAPYDPRWKGRTYVFAAGIALIPCALVLGLLLAGRWVARGFKRREGEPPGS